jgi:hypothetical protein
MASGLGQDVKLKVIRVQSMTLKALYVRIEQSL